MRVSQRFLITLGLLIISALSIEAGKVGNALLQIQQQGINSNQSVVQVGDILTVELFAQTKSDILTGVEIFLDFNDNDLELISTNTSTDLIQPFTQGNFLNGIVFANNTLGDKIGNSNSNNLPLFQLRYQEEIPPDQSSGSQRGVVGKGIIATAQFRVFRVPASGTTEISVRRTSPTGSETGYYLQGDPGHVYIFADTTDLLLTVQELSSETLVRADFNENGVVDFPDFLEFAKAFSTAQSAYDFDENGTVDFTDFLKFASLFGRPTTP